MPTLLVKRAVPVPPVVGLLSGFLFRRICPLMTAYVMAIVTAPQARAQIVTPGEYAAATSAAGDAARPAHPPPPQSATAISFSPPLRPPCAGAAISSTSGATTIVSTIISLKSSI